MAQQAATVPAAAVATEVSVTHPWVMWLGGAVFVLVQGLFAYIWNNQKKDTEDRLNKLEERLDTEIADLAETVEKGFRELKEDVLKQFNHATESYARSQRELYEDIRKGREEQRQHNEEFWKQVRGSKEEMSAVRLELAQKYHTKSDLQEVVNAAISPLTIEIRHLKESFHLRGPIT